MAATVAVETRGPNPGICCSRRQSAVVEIVCGALLIVGFLTRLASIPLLIDILVAIATTKIPMLSKAGFWAMMHETRTDFCMLLGLIFLLLVGSGTLSFDDRLSRQPDLHVRKTGIAS
jgi:uncharacterized membrane protein YphA (DoxX/SURF4 family)